MGGQQDPVPTARVVQSTPALLPLKLTANPVIAYQRQRCCPAVLVHLYMPARTKLSGMTREWGDKPLIAPRCQIKDNDISIIIQINKK